MKKYYYSLTENKRIIFWTIVVSLVTVFISSFCFFLNLYGIPFGIVLGTIISVINFKLLEKQTIKCFSTKNPAFTSVSYYLLRMFLYALGLALAIVLTKYVVPLFDVFAVLGSYLLHKIVLFIYGTWKGVKK